MTLLANEKTIIPLNLWINGQNTTVSLIRFDRFTGYHFDDNGAKVNYTLCSVDGDTKTDISSGCIHLSNDIIDAWTTDDNVIFNNVLQQLNIQEAV